MSPAKIDKTRIRFLLNKWIIKKKKIINQTLNIYDFGFNVYIFCLSLLIIFICDKFDYTIKWKGKFYKLVES